MPVDVVVLNGASSSGTSSIAAALASTMPRPFLRFGVDNLVDALPAAGGIEFGVAGEVAVDGRFRGFEHAWYRGLAAIARDGVGVIVDEVFLAGAEGQSRLAEALDGLAVCWVGVRCDAAVAAVREATREDRVTGMATAQADVVHQGVRYDLEVDTTNQSPAEAAAVIYRHLAGADLEGYLSYVPPGGIGSTTDDAVEAVREVRRRS